MKSSKATLKKIVHTPLAVVVSEGRVCMLMRTDKKSSSNLYLSWSDDGINFVPDSVEVKIKIPPRRKEKIENCRNFSLSRTPNGYVMTYVRNAKTKKNNKLIVARSQDLYEWRVLSELSAEGFQRASIAYDKPLDVFELYTDGLFLRSRSSRTLSVWKGRPSLLLTSRRDNFDSDDLSLIGSFVTEQGILVIYDASIKNSKKNTKQTLIQAGAVLFDINNPKRIIWRSEFPVWQGVVETKKEKSDVYPIGFASLHKKFLIYWMTSDGVLIIATVSAIFKELEEARYQPKILERFDSNPILESRRGHAWEGEGTFNPTVVQDDEGVVHILYRALGHDGVSRVGYAQSKDGMHFTKRSPYPIFEPSIGYGIPNPGISFAPANYNPAMYLSGGGWGGAEDPKAVKIGDTVYMLYMAFEGWNSMRIALTSISVSDFKAGRWHWKKPRLISPPEERHKNWVLFPEKINGKYAILHGIAPKILVDYVDNIDTFDGYIYSERPEGPQPGRKGKWDGLLRGAGPSPVKTEIGWLLLYHALDKRDSSRYKLGAMILDKDNPTKVLYRSSHPILSPDMHYENNGKPGIVYASGATIKGPDLHVYYGGGDKVSCVATTPLVKFLKYMVTGKPDSYEMKKAE